MYQTVIWSLDTKRCPKPIVLTKDVDLIPFNMYFRVVQGKLGHDLTLSVTLVCLTLLMSPAFPLREKTNWSISYNVHVLITPALQAKKHVFLKSLQFFFLCLPF